MAYSAAVLVQQGKLLESSVLCRQVIKAAGDQPTEIWAQMALYLLGCIYLEWGLLDDARRCLLRADNLAEMTQTLTGGIGSGSGWREWHGHGERPRRHSTRSSRPSPSRTKLGTLQTCENARAQQARFWLASNRPALARRWADSCDLDPYLPPEYERQIEHLTYVRLLVQEGRPDLALRILQRIDERAKDVRPARRSRRDPALDRPGAQGARQHC